ncbi:tRNA (adenine(22)-N(1))-methyltransferase TrmK [Rummeliibacillus sp. TYF-LIM-RU47]|uniref:tRNA (adenine(22)-N(1))-methyltransferase n=1 Tax=Rummeliibacillus sp. TYF-LIM-RU47 TaxID=2608406 RepID=UPI001238BC02|nr:tRNA (adenine(22)-N(1))-methyltransferase TrmK [Rummeliibacillus sp. TYF-LIM-RU47]
MNAQKLSKRLQTVASFVPEKAVVADIGSDHAYLPCYLVLQGVIHRAIAGEVVKGPYESACNEVRKEQLQESIAVRFADGLQAIEKEDGVTAITIAGMGGPLIASILEKDAERLQGVERLILQPNIHAIAIREWAMANGWKIINEEILKEDEKIYEVLVLERGEETLNTVQLLLGPVLYKEKNAVFKEKWQHEINQWLQVLEALKQAEPTTAIAKKERELQQKIELVKEVLKD